jgi:peptide/nickel transport system substrate-binding protein
MKTMAKIILAVFVTVLLGFGSASGAQLVIGSKLEPSSVDPHYHNLGPNNAIARHIFGRLVDTNEKQQRRPSTTRPGNLNCAVA